MDTALHLYLRNQLEETSRLIIAGAPDVDIANSKAETVLLTAFDCRSDIKIIELPLEKGADCHARRGDDESPLSLACKHRDTELVRLLLERGG